MGSDPLGRLLRLKKASGKSPIGFLWLAQLRSTPKVQKDVSLPNTEACERQAEQEIKRQKVAWRDKAEGFIQDVINGSRTRRAEKGENRHRIKTFRWLCATDASLRACTGRGWAYFMQPPDTTVHHLEWPTIAWAVDQGSDGMAALNYLLYKRVAVMKVADQSHRISNDADLALKDVGVDQLVALVSFIIGTDSGPWGSGRWHQSMIEATENYLKIADPETCALYNEFLPKIAADRNETHMLHDPDWKRTTFDDVKTVYVKKEQRTPGTRWFSFVDHAKAFMPKWNTKLLLVSYHLVQAGHFDSNARLVLLRDSLGRRADDDPQDPAAPVEQATTGRDTASERDLRKRCANQLQLQGVVLADGDTQKIIKACCSILQHPRRFHGLQNKHNRNTEKVREWYAEQAVGGGLLHLLDMVDELSNPANIEQIGFWCPGQARPIGSTSPSGDFLGAWLQRENQLASIFGGLCCRALGRRLSTMSWHERQLPGKLAGLLIPDSRAEVQEWIKLYDTSWRAANAQLGAWWTAARNRSSWQHLVVQKAMSSLKRVSLDLRNLEHVFRPWFFLLRWWFLHSPH